MKKLFTLLLFTLTAFTFKTVAQSTTCNAGFDFSISGLTVKFTAAITGDPTINHHYWKFGDGKTSSEISPVHVFTNGGVYTVKHIFYRKDNSGAAACVDSIEKRIELPTTTLSCNLRAAFTFERDPSQPNKVKFTNASTPAADIHAVKWSFGDGTYSTDFNTSHVYTTSGLYKVCLIVKKDNVCQRDTCINVQVQVPPPPCNLEAYFAWRPDSVHINKIFFQNLSHHFEPGDSIRWTFGDGTSSTDVNPTHTFSAAGTYNVCIRVQKKTAAGTTACVREYCKQVVVGQVPPPVCNLQAYFAWRPDSVHINKIFFQNLSQHFEQGDSIRWTFGDGTSSTDINPTHTYTAAGIYNVCIRVKKKSSTATYACVKEYCKQVVVGNNICRMEANFRFEADATNKNKIWFKNTSAPLTSALKIEWSFGDGTTSNAMHPEHVYTRAGIYEVCLKIYSSNTCYRKICKTVEIRENEVSCLELSKFSITRSTANCLEFKFIPAVQNTNLKYVWSFGDGTGSTEMTPSHIYPRSGNYTVYLTVYRSSTCVSTSFKVAETGPCFSCNNIWAKFEYKRETSNKIWFHALSNYPILSQSWTITKLTLSGSTTVSLSGLNPYYVFNEPGDYRVCLRVVTAGQCVKEYCEVIHIPASTECSIKAYPNPATNNVSVGVTLPSPQVIHVYIFNSLNILVKHKDQQGNTGTNTVTTNIEGLVPGWYTIKVMYGNRVCYAKFQKI